jgi:thiol peroxidase
MAQITFKGNPVHTAGDLPKESEKAKDFKVVKDDLTEASLSSFGDKIKVLIAVPSLDTSVCALETRSFNQKLNAKEGVVGIVVSKDLPFAMKRYSESNQVKGIVNASDFRYGEFVKNYNTELVDGPLKGLSARAVFVLDRDNTIRYTELVPEIAEEPNYDKALEVVDKLLN